MSLSTAGSGLLDTHVKWLDVQNKLQKTLKTEAVFGENRKIQRIGESNGMVSRMGIVTPQWEGTNVSDLPNKFIVKILSSLTMLEFSASVDGMSSHESNSFNDILASNLPAYRKAEVTAYKIIEKYGEGRIPVPMMLKAVAHLQTISLKITEDEKSSLPKEVFSNVAKELFRSTNEDFLKDMETVGDGCFLDLLQEFKKFNEVLLSDENMETLDKWNRYQNLPDVIVHNDLWIANCLWRRENEKLKLKAIIDYQTASLGCGAADLCAALINLGGYERREHKNKLIQDFYGYLEEEMGGKIPFCLEMDRTTVSVTEVKKPASVSNAIVLLKLKSQQAFQMQL